MNEYQDQSTWYEVQCATTFEWITMADADTYTNAADHLSDLLETNPDCEGHEHRIKRVRGLAEMDCS